MNNLTSNQKGIAAILTIIIISAVSIIAINFISWQASADLEISYLGQKERELDSIVNGCLDEALWQLKSDWSFTITDREIVLGEGTCVYTVENSAADKQIIIEIQVDDYYKNIEATAENDNSLINIVNFNIVNT